MAELQELPRVDSANERIKANFSRIVGCDFDSTDPYEAGYYTNRGLQSYNKLLPTYNGVTFLEIMQNKIDQSKSPLEILDIGCGRGIALAELIRDYKIQATGIAATDLRDFAPLNLQEFMSQIGLRIGNIEYLSQVIGTKQFDFIISVKTFEHLVHPQSVLHQSMDLLKPDGLAFIEGPNFDRVFPSVSPSAQAA